MQIWHVVRVIDGDTITVKNIRGEIVRVRLTGIDAPESDQPFGKESKTNLNALVGDKDVRIEISKEDRYGRSLGKVWISPPDCVKCNKTINVNRAQISSGMAWWYRKYANEQSAEDRKSYEFSEEEAKNLLKGLWSNAQSVAPWDWRRGVPLGVHFKGLSVSALKY